MGINLLPSHVLLVIHFKNIKLVKHSYERQGKKSTTDYFLRKLIFLVLKHNISVIHVKHLSGISIYRNIFQ